MTTYATEIDRDHLRIALIGAGLMAKSHTIAYRSLPSLFPDVPAPELALLADANDESASEAARRLGFARWTGDWREAVADPDIDIVDIVTPNWLHYEVAMAAIAHGKHVYCEKPLALTPAEARRMWEAAQEAGVKTIVGFSYLGNPGLQFAKQLLDDGTLGDLWSVKAQFILQANADPSLPRTWHYERSKAGSGALGDLGSHIIAIAEMLGGPLESVFGEMSTVVRERPEASGALSYGSRAAEGARLLPVENDDITVALGRYRAGGTATLEANRVGNGHPFDLRVEVTGSKGSVVFAQQEGFRVDLYLRENGDDLTRGVSSVALGPQHPNYSAFWPFPGVPVGLHELKAVEVRNLFRAVRDDTPAYPSFHEGWRVVEVIDAIEKSNLDGKWTSVTP